MHLAEGATPGTNPSSADDRLVQFSNSVMTSQQSQREQVPIHVPSSQATGAPALQPHNIPMTSATNPSSLAPSKSSVHDPSVRYKVSAK